jgi:hypothetical protein
MAALSEILRKTTTFLLAVFLWFHALFILNVQSTFTAKCAYYLRLTTSETVLVGLLVIFSFTAGSGFWKPFRSLLYIYQWFKTQAGESPDNLPVSGPQNAPTVPKQPLVTPKQTGIEERAKEFANFLLRPFRRFTVLWCILLLVSTHTGIVWVCLAVISLHLVRKIIAVLKVMLFFDVYLKKAVESVFETVGGAVDIIDAVTSDTTPSNELRTTWRQLKTWGTITAFLRNEYLVTRWAWVWGVISFGLIYIYFALLFSFIYFGIARVNGLLYSWPTALVDSLFIPLFATELPNMLVLRVLGGLQFVLVLGFGFGTFFNFLNRSLFAIHTAATIINDKLTDKRFQEQFVIVGAKLEQSPRQSR